MNLSNMTLIGRIPREFGNLSFLVSLDMGSNNFHGNLPQEMVHLCRLKFFDLSCNSFSRKVPSWFGFLHQLQVLNLGNNSFTEGQIQKVIGSLTNLRELNLTGNKLIGSKPLSLSNTSRLETLVVSFNSLQGNIPEVIDNLHNMKVLPIHDNELMGSIPFTIFNISRIKIIAFTAIAYQEISPMVYAMVSQYSKGFICLLTSFKVICLQACQIVHNYK
ncbi:hypothetical protein P3S67_013335 [Capsicum chacoense]